MTVQELKDTLEQIDEALRNCREGRQIPNLLALKSTLKDSLIAQLEAEIARLTNDTKRVA